ncbi:MAG: hypothetical protein ABJD13_02490 [Paracoccaceae bacterium]
MATFAICHDDIFDEMTYFDIETGEDEIAKNGGFLGVVSRHMRFLVEGLGIEVELCPKRLKSAHTLWQEDLKHSSDMDMDGRHLDHFKHAGYLAFWLRRASPIIRIDFDKSKIENLPKSERYYLDFLVQFGNEHLAFTLGHEICMFFQCYRVDMPVDPKAFGFDSAFAHDMNSTMKRKNMSPHALNLIYRALFLK